MASRCIIGECPMCTELMWEDEDLKCIGGYMLHHQCVFKELSTEQRIKVLEEIIEVLKDGC